MNLLNFWSCHKKRYLNEIIGETFVKCLVYAYCICIVGQCFIYGQLKNREKNYLGLNRIRKVKSVVLNVQLFSGINVSRRY